MNIQYEHVLKYGARTELTKYTTRNYSYLINTNIECTLIHYHNCDSTEENIIKLIHFHSVAILAPP